MKVLLIEPDKLLANIYRVALENAGHELAWCQTAQTAIHLVDNFAPDVVVLELQLAAHNGIEFLYELRSYADWSSLPVIVHTVVPPDAAKTFVDLGVTNYLYKPKTKLSSLVRAVNKAILIEV